MFHFNVQRAFSTFIRLHGKCQLKGLDNVICGEERLVCSHIVPRYFKPLATNELNALCCCDNHEKYYLDKQNKWFELIKMHFPDRFDYLSNFKGQMGKGLRRHFEN